MPRFLTDHERELVRKCLAEGLGVEDMHVKRGLPRDSVRRFIAEISRTGELERIYRKAREQK